VRTEHPIRRNAAQLTLFDLHATGNPRLVQRNGYNLPHLYICRAGHDLQRLLLSNVEHANLQCVRILMFFNINNLSCYNLFDFRAHLLRSFNHGAGHGKRVGVFLRRNAGHINEFVKPTHCHFHIKAIPFYQKIMK